MTKQEVQAGDYTFAHEYTYHAGVVSEVHTENNKVPSTPTTNLVSRLTVAGRKFDYVYDNEDRITSCVDTYGTTNLYTYDETGRLTRETHNDTVAAYVYDRMGNVTKRGHWDDENNCFIYDNSYIQLSYSVSKPDRISVIHRNDGTTSSMNVLEYDEVGNPTKYKNGETLVWEKGRQLKAYGNIATYTYNANGIRTSKTANGITYSYDLEGSKVLRITHTDTSGNSHEVIPFYDTNDSPIGIIYNGTPYWYVKNLQGDILSIKDSTGYDVVRYKYDAWGKVTIRREYSGCDLARINPFFYRGYLYDGETKLYYLQSRYYDPEIGRFLNPDEPTFIGAGNSLSPNAYAYCDNEPVNMVDPLGFFATYAPLSGDITTVLSTAIPILAAAKTALFAAVKTAVAAIGNVFLVVGSIVVVLTIVFAVIKVAEALMEAVRERIDSKQKKLNSPYVVYVLTRTNNVKGVFYVGRTKNSVRREAAHRKDPTKVPFVMYDVIACKTEAYSRIAEQALLSACLVTKTFTMDTERVGTGSNKIRGIAKQCVNEFKNDLKDISQLLTSTAESDMLLIEELMLQ